MWVYLERLHQQRRVLIFQLRVSLNRNCNGYRESSGTGKAVYLRSQSKLFVYLHANTTQGVQCVVQSENLTSSNHPRSQVSTWHPLPCPCPHAWNGSGPRLPFPCNVDLTRDAAAGLLVFYNLSMSPQPAKQNPNRPVPQQNHLILTLGNKPQTARTTELFQRIKFT